MRPSTKEALKTSLWIPVVVAILTLGLGIVISEVQTKVDCFQQLVESALQLRRWMHFRA